MGVFTLILLGVSGAGKTNLGRMLKELGFHFIDMSTELERRAYEWHNEIGAALRQWLEHERVNGVLVDDQHVIAVLDAAICEAAEDQPIVITGCPRTIQQGELVATLLARYARTTNVLAVTLAVDLEEATRRALKGDEERAARADSTKERVAHSHMIFAKNNIPICTTLRMHSIECIILNANGSKTEVEQNLLALIEPHVSLSQTNTH